METSNDMDGLQFNIDMEKKGVNQQQTAQQINQDASSKKQLPKFLQGSSHPGVCILAFIFKGAAIASYLLLNVFIGNLVMTYITVILLCALDFYVTKNITGR